MKDRLQRTNVRKTSHRLKRVCLGLSLFALAFSAVSIVYIVQASTNPSTLQETPFTVLYEENQSGADVLNQGR